MTQYSIIVAADESYGIGINNILPWHISEDLKHFKQLTTDHTVLMGYNTWLSLPKKPLPKRTNIILTSKNIKIDGVIILHSIDEAIQYCQPYSEVFIIGGQQIYKQFFPIATKLYFTKVHHIFKTDTKLEGFNPHEWQLLKEELFDANEQRSFSFSFLEYDRIM